jgi:hypothetical protein
VRSTHVNRALAVSLLTLAVVSCSGAAERTLIAQFFAASRLRDLTALHGLATVLFEPTTDGIVTKFELVSVSSAEPNEGRSSTKRVVIAAPVRLPDGRTVSRTFAVTLTHGLPESDQRWGGWMVTAIAAAPASPSPPPS